VSASLEASRTDVAHQRGKAAAELARARTQAAEAQQLGRAMEEAKKVGRTENREGRCCLRLDDPL